MTTLATNAEKWLADEWEKLYSSAVLSGIVGDLAHKARGGYHISREDQGKSNYSVTRTDDKSGPSDRAAAVDMTMNTSDIKKCHVRLRTVWKNRANDPRMKYINAWNGWDGEGDAGRYDVVTGSIATATADHKWHIHLEIRRRYVNDIDAMKAILSMLKGESLAEYRGLDSAKVEEEDMPITDADIKKIWDSKPWSADYSAGVALQRAYNNTNALAAALQVVLEKVDLSPEELEEIKNTLDFPTAQETANATVAALGGMNAAQLADVLKNVLGPQRVAALKAVL